ncbi:protein MCM10 homolog [Pocillopora damicornis]|uniref:protein MCM10 homolog n=1 Tax=Pocillopora damicornis TaxID=46731 RepID=UPI000F5514A4|nr:protein MCM10 homolog [Pocillopora damicornis]
MKPENGLGTKGSGTTRRLTAQDENPNNGKMAAGKKKAAVETETRTGKSMDDEDFSCDRFSSLRIINPLISSVVMEKRMEGRRMVKISQISTKIKGNNDIDGDWVTIGVIVQKMPPKKSSNHLASIGYGPSGKAPLMKKFKKDLNTSTFMYQGRTVNASSHNTDHKKKNVSLKSLSVGKRNGSTEAMAKGDSVHQKGNNSNPTTEHSDFLVQLLEMPTVGSRNLIRHLNQDEEQKKPEEERKPTMSASELLKAHEKELKRTKSSSTGTLGAPMLGRGLAPGSDLFFDGSPKFGKRKLNDTERAKLKALSLVKQKGPIEKDDPNAVRKKLSPKAQEEIQKKAFEDSSKENDDGNVDQDSRKKRRRILGPEFGSIDLTSEEGKKLLAAKSQHVGAVREAEAEREEKYFNELEKKERLEDKMKTITELKVKVVCCKQCNYVAEGASELCHKEKHALKYCKALKKFFVCKDCKTRTVSYGSPIPKHPCRQCGATNYQKTSIYKETEGPKIAGETLLVRGEELPKFLNSL